MKFHDLMKVGQFTGFHLSPAGTDETTLLEIVRKSKARVYTVMDSVGLAKRVFTVAQEALGGVVEPIVIARLGWPDQDWNAAKYADLDAYARARKALFGDFPLYDQFLNEPVTTSAAQVTSLMDKCRMAMRAYKNNGVLGAIGGFADASLFQQAALEAGLFDPFLAEASDWTNAGYGVIVHHNYFYGLAAVNGAGRNPRDMLEPGLVQRANWPTKEQFQIPSAGSWLAQGAADLDALFRVGAAYQLERQANRFEVGGRWNEDAYLLAATRFEAETGLTHGEVIAQDAATPKAQGAEANWLNMRLAFPMNRCVLHLKKAAYWYVLGEADTDDMPNMRVDGTSPAIEQKFAGGQKLRGILSQKRLFKAWYPTQSEARSYVDQLEYESDIQYNTGIGQTLFALNPSWPDYNYLTWPDFWPEFYAMVSRRTNPVTQIPTPVGKPDNAGPGQLVTLNTSSFVNQRSGPGTSYPVKQQINSSKVMEYYAGGHVQPGGANTYEWAYMVDVSTGVGGWVARVAVEWNALLLPVYPAPSVLWPVPFVDQYGPDAAPPNACAPAAGASGASYLLGRDVTALEFSLAMNRRAGAFSSPQDIERGAEALGLVARVYSANPNVGDFPLSLEAIRGAIQNGKVVIPLLQRGLIPGALAYYPYKEAHYCAFFGWIAATDKTEEAFIGHDPLATDSRGKSFRIGAAQLLAAIKSSTYPAGATYPAGTNTGYQGVIMERKIIAPPPPVNPLKTRLIDLRQQADALTKAIDDTIAMIE